MTEPISLYVWKIVVSSHKSQCWGKSMCLCSLMVACIQGLEAEHFSMFLVRKYNVLVIIFPCQRETKDSDNGTA